MRIVKMSGEVFGFDDIDACKAYFESVLPWQKGIFNFAGEGNKIAKDKLNKDENVLFAYNGVLIAIAKAKDLILNKDNRVRGIEIDLNTLKIFKENISTFDLENELKKYGYSETIYKTQGWNILDKNIETKAIEFIKNKEWEIYQK